MQVGLLGASRPVGVALGTHGLMARAETARDEVGLPIPGDESNLPRKTMGQDLCWGEQVECLVASGPEVPGPAAQLTQDW